MYWININYLAIILRYDLQRYEEATECLNLLLEINAYNSECYI